jgi:hypothetical protein
MTVQQSVRTTTPPQWSDLFTHHRYNVFEGEPNIPESIRLGSEWTDSATTPVTPPSEGVLIPAALNEILMEFQ